MRAKGIASFRLVTGAAGAFNTFANPLGLAAFAWKFYFFYVVWIAIEFVVVWWQCPETKGVSLEDIALLIDGNNATISKVNPMMQAVLAVENEEVAGRRSSGLNEKIEHVEVEHGS